MTNRKYHSNRHTPLAHGNGIWLRLQRVSTRRTNTMSNRSGDEVNGHLDVREERILDQLQLRDLLISESRNKAKGLASLGLADSAPIKGEHGILNDVSGQLHETANAPKAVAARAMSQSPGKR